jgi:hypothetical protein
MSNSWKNFSLMDMCLNRMNLYPLSSLGGQLSGEQLPGDQIWYGRSSISVPFETFSFFSHKNRRIEPKLLICTRSPIGISGPGLERSTGRKRALILFVQRSKPDGTGSLQWPILAVPVSFAPPLSFVQRSPAGTSDLAPRKNIWRPDCVCARSAAAATATAATGSRPREATCGGAAWSRHPAPPPSVPVRGESSLWSPLVPLGSLRHGSL